MLLPVTVAAGKQVFVNATLGLAILVNNKGYTKEFLGNAFANTKIINEKKTVFTSYSPMQRRSPHGHMTHLKMFKLVLESQRHTRPGLNVLRWGALRLGLYH